MEQKESRGLLGALVLGSALGGLAGLPAQSALAETDEGLSGRAAFSYANARGNTDTLATTGEAEAVYNRGDGWVYDGRFGFVMREESNVTTEERYELRLTANYYWQPENYVFGRLDWRKDNYGAVEEEFVPSAGYGHVFVDNDKHSLRGELALGYRFADLQDGSREEGVAVSSGVRYRWNITDATNLFQNLLVQWSSDNTLVESETGVSTNLVGNLSGRFTYRVRRNSDVPAGTDNSDFLTTIGLEYKF